MFLGLVRSLRRSIGGGPVITTTIIRKRKTKKKRRRKNVVVMMMIKGVDFGDASCCSRARVSCNNATSGLAHALLIERALFSNFGCWRVVL